MSYSKLRGRIRECYGTQADFANALNMNEATLSHKLNARTEWSRAEVEKVCRLLEIPIKQVGEYFFSE